MHFIQNECVTALFSLSATNKPSPSWFVGLKNLQSKRLFTLTSLLFILGFGAAALQN